MKSLKLAAQFLTRLPIRIKGPVEELDLARSMALFPIVGLLIGIINYCVYYVFALCFPISIAATLTIIMNVFLTGNIHLDGLMDTADGVFSGRDRGRMLTIMKDSCVGAHGVIAGISDLLMRYALLTEIHGQVVPVALIVSPVIGRWSQVLGAGNFPYARKEGGTGGFTQKVGLPQVIWATIYSLIVILGASWFESSLSLVILLPVAFTIAYACYAYFNKKLGGLTGDVFGAMNEVVEIAIVLTVLKIMQ